MTDNIPGNKGKALDETDPMSSLRMKLKKSDPEIQNYVLALEAENLKLQKQVAKLQAENVSLNNRIEALVEQKGPTIEEALSIIKDRKHHKPPKE